MLRNATCIALRKTSAHPLPLYALSVLNFPGPSKSFLSSTRAFRTTRRVSDRAEKHRPPHVADVDRLKQADPEKTGKERDNDDTSRSRPPFSARFRKAWDETPVKWYPIPVGLGLAVIGFQQYRHLRTRANEELLEGLGDEERRAIRASGPWQVHVASALPLKTLSRLWGVFNDITLPHWARVPGFKLYSWIFGCDLTEMDDPDLTHYPNLGSFFYRKLKPGCRPVADSLLVSPADGRVLHFGQIEGRRVEQVKGLTYSLDAFFGKSKVTKESGDEPADSSVTEEDFADVNWVHYTLDELLGDSVHEQGAKTDAGDEQKKLEILLPREGGDLKRSDRPSMARTLKQNVLDAGHTMREGYGLYFAVIYLAPGDYHRFHSPCNWMVEKRRHFPGELFSVSPYMAKLLENLFVVNERAVLLGHWRHGFFSMVPVGATNVGSIIINFDKDMRTNQRGTRHKSGNYTELTYKNSIFSRFNGIPVTKGDEVGGFKLGSTVVLVFEAPLGWKFAVEEGQIVKVGQSLGDIST